MASSPVSHGRQATAVNLVLLLLLIALIVAIGIVASWFLGRRPTVVAPSTSVTLAPTVAAPSPSLPTVSPTPLVTPSPEPSPVTSPSPSSTATAAEAATVPSIIIPVANIKTNQLRDTFTDARSEGRTHDAIDIMAAGNTPVLAAADGRIARFFNSERGGITIYQQVGDGKVIFYYAHLARYADGLQEGQQVKQGQVIGYVGDTGNAGAGNYHLHFAIWLVTDPKKYWDGLNVNPYPLLAHAAPK